MLWELGGWRLAEAGPARHTLALLLRLWPHGAAGTERAAGAATARDIVRSEGVLRAAAEDALSGAYLARLCGKNRVGCCCGRKGRSRNGLPHLCGHAIALCAG